MGWSCDIVRRLGLSCVLAVAACAAPARLPGSITPSQPATASAGDMNGAFAWSGDRLLQWSDFLGRADMMSDAAALTSYVLSFETHCAGDRFSFHVESRFLPGRSWVKSSHLLQKASDLTLQHERTHFDLSEVQARRARQSLVALPSPCALDDQARDALMTPFVRDDAGLQERYDRETAHGTNARRQAEWNEQVRLWLRGLPPDPQQARRAFAQPVRSPVASPSTPAESRGPIDAVVAKAAAYVKEYQRTLTQIIADEEYEQQIVTQTPEEPGMARRRLTRSEVFFLFAGDWMAMRDVVSVNGAPLETRPSLRQALATLPTAEVARRFKVYNSRFNVGRVFRNFNEPTLSLLFLDDRYRSNVVFTWKRLQKGTDGDWVTVEFLERPGGRGLIVDLTGAVAPSKGRFEVHAETGRIRFAQMTTTIGAVRAELTTTYAPDEHVGILVPVTFAEHYLDGVPPRTGSDPRTRIQTRFEDIRGRAEYRNYRRFEVKVIIR